MKRDPRWSEPRDSVKTYQMAERQMMKDKIMNDIRKNIADARRENKDHIVAMLSSLVAWIEEKL